MYYRDLTRYRYYRGPELEGSPLNVGWLDVKHPFPKKKASEQLLDALFERCLHPVIQMRGFHKCEFCDGPALSGMKVSRHGREIGLGSAEIRVNGKHGKVYAAPDLIYHYVSAHDYDPPQEFLEALLVE